MNKNIVYSWIPSCVVTHEKIQNPIQISSFSFPTIITTIQEPLSLSLFEETHNFQILRVGSGFETPILPGILAADCKILAVPPSLSKLFITTIPNIGAHNKPDIDFENTSLQDILNMDASPSSLSSSQSKTLEITKHTRLWDPDTQFPGFEDLARVLQRIISHNFAPIILTGLSGSGKTWVMKTVGTSYLGPSFFLNVSSLIRSRVGESEQLFAKIISTLDSLAFADPKTGSIIYPLLIVDSLEQLWSKGSHSTVGNLATMFKQWITSRPSVSILASSLDERVCSVLHGIHFRLGILDFQQRFDILSSLFSRLPNISADEIFNYSFETQGCLPCDLQGFFASKVLNIPFLGPFLLRNSGSSSFPPLFIPPSKNKQLSVTASNDPSDNLFSTTFNWFTPFLLSQFSTLNLELPNFVLVFDRFGKHRKPFVSWLSKMIYSHSHIPLKTTSNSNTDGSVNTSISTSSFHTKLQENSQPNIKHRTQFLNLFSVHSGALFRKGVGDTDKIISKMFEKLSLFKPCILCVEDVDAILPRLSLHIPHPKICVIGLSANPERLKIHLGHKSSPDSVDFSILQQY